MWLKVAWRLKVLVVAGVSALHQASPSCNARNAKIKLEESSKMERSISTRSMFGCSYNNNELLRDGCATGG
ncbi:unnamed protein product [Victoria cruziana]